MKCAPVLRPKPFACVLALAFVFGFMPVRIRSQEAATLEGVQRERIKSTLFVPTPLPALAPESYGRFEPETGVLAERISYATQFGMRVPAILYLPKTRTGRIPALIVVNGHGGDKYSWYAFYAGILYARAGAAVLTYDPAGEGERNSQRKSGTRQHDRLVPPDEMARRLSGLMITDVMQAVSYLSQRPEVDPGRIAAMGYSMGSFVLGIGGAVETRLRACVLVGGGNLDGPGGYWDSSSKKMCQAIPYQSLHFLGDRGAVLYSLHAARGATFVFNGLQDTVVAIPNGGRQFFDDLRKRTVALRGSDRNVFDFDFEPTGSHRPYFLTRPVALWLERRLDFPNWSEESIREMPETHIAEWVQPQDVLLDRLYATEEREGGTRALGRGIRGIPRAQLDALPLDKWQARKDRYVYETWLEEARKRLPSR